MVSASVSDGLGARHSTGIHTGDVAFDTSGTASVASSLAITTGVAILAAPYRCPHPYRQHPTSCLASTSCH